MCKIIALTDTKKLNLKKCINDIGNTLLKSEKDGFGYAVQGKMGVFGEKTTASHFRSRLNANNIVSLPITKRRYCRFGQPGELTGPGIFHGRTSTNVGGLINTHPMQMDGWNLIHNGVVTDHGPVYDNKTDNDSEDLLHRLILGIEHVEKDLSGYYAFAAIDPNGMLHIARDKWAKLYIAYSAVYDTHIIATTETLIRKLDKMIDAKIGPIDEIESDVYMVFNGNELIHYQSIKPRGYSITESKHSQSSIGVSLGGGEIKDETKGKAALTGLTSESDWETTYSDWDNAIADLESPTGNETEYYKYRHELDNLDSSYTILDENDNELKLWEFKKLLAIEQEQCIVVRPDGTVVDADGDEYLYSKRA